MNREIKFRAWDRVKKEMNDISDVDWGAGHNYFTDNSYVIIQYTGLKDKNGKEIYEGDMLSLNGNMTADDSMGWLPNGWIFDEEDKYPVRWDEKLAGWVLEMPTKYDRKDEEAVKYLNHARGLLINGDIEIIGNIYENPELLK